MNLIKRIRLEDGPEDGLELTPRLLMKLVGEEQNLGADISLFAEPTEPAVPKKPYLLGRYCLVQVADGTAKYRWKTG